MSAAGKMIVYGWVAAGVMAGTMAGLFRVGSRDVEWNLRLTAAAKGILASVCAVNAAGIVILWESSLFGITLWSVFGGCLLAASVMDWWEQMVYRFVWWAAGTTSALMLLIKWHKQVLTDGEITGCSLGSSVSSMRFVMIFVMRFAGLMGFIILQEVFFVRFYGRADCHAFCVCAIMLAAEGQGFAGYVIHMAVAFGGMTLVQFSSGNIARNGRLKNPVSFVPYIAAAFWLWVAFDAGKWYI
ncbi:MAG: hypothetical protein NC399_05995 [Muribaculum sp.]|nr:hypothetical protein [Muribaculum sp.]